MKKDKTYCLRRLKEQPYIARLYQIFFVWKRELFLYRFLIASRFVFVLRLGTQAALLVPDLEDTVDLPGHFVQISGYQWLDRGTCGPIKNFLVQWE